MNSIELRLHGLLIDELIRRYKSFRRQSPQCRPAGLSNPGQSDAGRPHDRRRSENSTARRLLDFLCSEITSELDELSAMATRNREFRHSCAQAIDSDELATVLLDYANQLGSSRWNRWGDRRSLRRWFDVEAVNERYLRRRGERELHLQFMFERLGVVVNTAVAPMKSVDNVLGLWTRLRIESLVNRGLSYGGDQRVRTAAMKCLSNALHGLPQEFATGVVSPAMLATIQRIATDTKSDVWLQCHAIDVLASVGSDLFWRVCHRRLRQIAEGDDLFVRRHCLRIAARTAGPVRFDTEFWEFVANDPSPAVRQQLAATLWQLQTPDVWLILSSLITSDPNQEVRAAAIHGSIDSWKRPDLRFQFLHLLADRLDDERESFCLRTALSVATEWAVLCYSDGSGSTITAEVDKIFRSRLLPAICRLRMSADEIPVRRWAAAASERIWVHLAPERLQLYDRLRARLQRLDRGGSHSIPRNWLKDVDDDTLGRILAVISQDDFGVELIQGWRGYRLTRQPHFGFRLWRAWNEFWRPGPDKRQGHRHTLGRIAHGDLQAPSRIMGELSQTKVLGEPLVVESDGTWRPFLPLVDDFVGSINRNLVVAKTTRLYSSEGVTEIRPPRNLLRRGRSALQLITQFPDLAEMRNWDAKTSAPPERYIEAMQKMGFQVNFRPYKGRDADPSVTQFFPVLLAFSHPLSWQSCDELLENYSYYFTSAFENTLVQLALFTTVALLLFLMRHAVANMRIWRARRAIPLSIGGWGTRGKSGTERLKAALFVGTGHGIVSKTTGCEAMFIHAAANGEPLEIPLYRPGDKATIWEQSDLLRTAARIRPSVFLWECMALTPDYVDVLQRQWMSDDVATITNTYPDHEDLQGPSGLDVATTIAGFVPGGARLFTTEQQMAPLVKEQCRRRHTTLRTVGWLEAGLLPEDILARFPYREHPDNIALVAAMAEELGCSRDFSLKAMADHLIPDLGVLKTHPVAQVQGCSIEFTNGMSANERFGCLGNWKRLNFDKHDTVHEPQVMLSTVVNNRADRVARSRVFASILVNDLSADRHFLIGGNLKGLLGFIEEAWNEFEHSLAFESGSTIDAVGIRDKLLELARRFRIPTDQSQIENTIRIMLDAICPDLDQAERDVLAQRAASLPDATLESLKGSQDHGDAQPHPACLTDLVKALETRKIPVALSERVTKQIVRLRECHLQLRSLLQTSETVRGADQLESLELQSRQIARKWFRQKLVIIDEYDASGDEIIQRIVDETPPGFLNRVMGIQNIKGTGLDFVYRFHAWDSCNQLCEIAESASESDRSAALDSLASLPEFGLLCLDRVKRTIDVLRNDCSANSGLNQVAVEAIQNRLAEGVKVAEQRIQRDQSSSSPSVHPVATRLLAWLEQWMEVQDATRRRKTADQVYRDLRDERISRRRAVEVLRELNKRQKGGWLANQLFSA